MKLARAQANEARAAVAQADDELGTALTHGLDLPLTALRVSLEALSRELSRHDDRRELVRGALEEMERLGRNVHDLVEFASRPAVLPLRCTLDEIVVGALRQLPVEGRARVLLATSTPDATLRAAGPLLVCALRRLLENALEAGAERVLAFARVEPGAVTLSVVDDGVRDFDPAWARTAFHSTRSNHLGLGLPLVERDAALLNGTLTLERTERRTTCAVLAVPIPEEAVA
jgi:K+-sensing histidine kinase KdpD